MKFLSEYTLTVLSEVAVAMRGRPLGFGMETQALEFAIGLNSANGRIRRGVKPAIFKKKLKNSRAESGMLQNRKDLWI